MLKRKLTRVVSLIFLICSTTSCSLVEAKAVEGLECKLIDTNEIFVKQTNDPYKFIEQCLENNKNKMIHEIKNGLDLIRKEKQDREEEYKKWWNENCKDFILTYYTSLDCENGYGAITCEGNPLEEGICASNVYPLGTIIRFEDGREFIVADRGGRSFNDETRLDVFIERYDYESNDEYKKRVNDMGIKHKKGVVIY